MKISPVRDRVAAGAVFFLAGAIALMGIISAEALYPGYSTAENTISDLGASVPPDIIVQPSATIFNATMIVTGLLIIAASFFVHRAFGYLLVSIPLTLLGAGVLGVGIFPGNYGTVHAIFALLAFLAGGISAIAAYRVETVPFRYFSVILGVITLFTLVSYFALGQSAPLAPLGIGGVERWIVYPVLVWMLGFGGYLMSDSSGR
ncbi:putative membrane protein [Methanolinea mesophila]|nr:putative membrane protein [Methanolinea mesophila]